MENKARIQDDLFENVNGEWLATAVIPDDKPSTGGFEILVDDVEKIMMNDLADFAAGRKHSDVAGMEDAVKLYRKILDTERRNKEGIEPVKGLLAEIKNTESVKELNEKAYDLMLKGVYMPFQICVEADMKNTSANALVLNGPDIILPDTIK